MKIKYILIGMILLLILIPSSIAKDDEYKLDKEKEDNLKEYLSTQKFYTTINIMGFDTQIEITVESIKKSEKIKEKDNKINIYEVTFSDGSTKNWITKK